MTRNIEYIKCNLCESDDYRVLYEGMPDREGVVEKFSASSSHISTDQIVKCNKCGLIYVNPRLKSKLIIKGYAEGDDEKFVSQEKGRMGAFKKALKLIEKIYPKKGMLLDIGTAGGTFLYVARESGWDVCGIEPNKWLCEWGKKKYNVDIKQGVLSDYKFKSNTFDVVTLWDVLEHVTDPKSYLKEINRILKPNGLLVITYPNIGSLIAKLMRRKWVFILSVHLYYFTPVTIKKLLEKTGFSPFKFKKHIQTLSLNYLIMRIKPYNIVIYRFCNNIVNILGIGDIQVPYWLGQGLVLARKNL